MVKDDDTVIASQVDLKISTVKPLHAYWTINTHNIIPQCPELIRSGFRKAQVLEDRAPPPSIKNPGPFLDYLRKLSFYNIFVI